MKKILFILLVFCSANVFSQKEIDDLMRKGDVKITRKDYKGAIDIFNKVLEINPGYPDAYLYRGMGEYLLNDLKTSMADFNKAIELQPDFAEAYFYRGVVNGDLKKNDDACNDWVKSFDLGFDGAGELIDKFCKDKEKEILEKNKK
ncbi:MAG: tetratricopeptide repeat protein [Bacteroidetes bacterium]|nr:tetratricopeptide repeat protein [Bacteroidota bacterium]